MSSAPWLTLMALVLVVSLLARGALLFLIALTALAAAGAARLWYRRCLDAVEYRRSFSHRRASFGDEVELTVEVVNRKLLPLAWLEIEDEVPGTLGVAADGKGEISSRFGRTWLSQSLSLGWYERVRRRYRIQCNARGEHVFGPARLRSGDVFGFGVKEVEIPSADRLLVYPRIVPIEELGLPAGDPFGDRRTRSWIFEDPLMTAGVRPYAPGDPLRRIDWKASARTQGLQVKLWEPTTTHRLVVMLNLSSSHPAWWWARLEPDVLEWAITVAASIATWAIENGYQVGLIANGHLGRSADLIKVEASRDPGQQAYILEALARALPFASVPFDEHLRRELPGLPYGTTLVVITATVSEPMAAILDGVRRGGHRVALLLVGDNTVDPRLAGVTTLRMAS